MSTLQVHRPGTIDWLSLTTPDGESSARFYAELLGWDIVRYETGAGTYLTAEVGGRDAAGILQPAPTIGDMALPAAWTVFIRVDDLDETLGLLVDLGGRIIERPREILEFGRSAVVADPTGAVFSVADFHPDFGIKVSDETGSLTFCEVLTRDPVTAVAFYSSLFGWVAERDEATGYTTFSIDHQMVAGLMAMPAEIPEEAPAHWLPYFSVTDCEEVAARAQKLGAVVHRPPRSVGVGTFAIVEDPQGAVVGLFEHR